jgi:hypothetical protein
MHVLPVFWLEVTFSASRALVAVRIIASERARNRKRWDFGISSYTYIARYMSVDRVANSVRTLEFGAAKLGAHRAGRHACGRQRTALALASRNACIISVLDRVFSICHAIDDLTSLY